MSNPNTPEGTYNAVATRDEFGCIVQTGYTKGKGTKYSVVHFQLLDPPNTTVPWFAYWTPATEANVMKAFRAMGFKGDNFAQVNEQELDQPVRVVIEHNEWEGKVHARVAWVNRPGAGSVKVEKSMTKPELLKFAAEMRSRWSSIPEVVRTDAPSNGVNVAVEDGGETEDQLPF